MSSKARAAVDPDFIVGTTELGSLLGISRRALHHLRDRGLEPTKPRGQYELHLVLRWLMNDQGEASDGVPSLDEARRDLAMAQRAKIELEMAERRKELLPTSEAVLQLVGIVNLLVEGLQAFPPRLAPVAVAQTDRAEAEDAIESECRELRERLARAVDEFRRDYEPGGGSATPTREDAPRPVGRPKRNNAGRRPRARAASK